MKMPVADKNDFFADHARIVLKFTQSLKNVLTFCPAYIIFSLNIQMTLYDELRALIDRFNEEKIAYALCGGLAMAAHGWPRATMDIDMLIEERNLKPARKIAQSLGFKHEPGRMIFCEGQIKIHRLVKFDGVEAVPLDLLIVTPALQPVWEQRSELESEHGKITVVSAEGLRLMKKLRKSGQDQDDIRKLEGNK